MNISIMKRLLLPETKEERELRVRLDMSIDRILDTLDAVDRKLDQMDNPNTGEPVKPKRNGAIPCAGEKKPNC